MYEWCMNDVYMARPPTIVIVLSVLPNWNKIVNQSINLRICVEIVYNIMLPLMTLTFYLVKYNIICYYSSNFNLFINPGKDS